MTTDKFKNILTILTLFFFIVGFTQENKEEQDSIFIRLLPRVQQDKILLRWAVNDALTWQKTTKTGFVLEKYTVTQTQTNQPDLQKVWEKTIKAEPLEQWQEIVEQDDNAAVIAQAIYGEGFAVESSGGKLATIINTLDELEQRYSFALLAADMNFEASKKAGWGYVDTDVKPNQKYVYRVKTAPSTPPISCKAAAIVVGLNNYEKLPKPIGFTGFFGDRKVMLTWEYELFKSIYTYYNLERSENGTDFEKINTKPLVNLNDKPNTPSKRMFHIDSLAQNNKKYYYRVQGVTPFGEQSEYSKTISGEGKPALPFTPVITDFQFTENPNEAIIYWEFPKEGEKITKKFQLKIAPKDLGTYKTVIDSIPATSRKIKYSKLGASNYVKITAVGTTPKQERTSFSTLIQPLDSIPPAVPTELEGTIDSLGVAKISWKANTEDDFNGYRVFRAFVKGEEPAQITVSPIKENSFIDTVQVKNLNSKVYYQVVAVDKRFNNSNKSEVLVVEKPDVIPPTSPIFSNYEVTNQGIIIQWINSSEEDTEHILSRKDLTDDTEWKVIYKTKDSIQQFIDDDIINNKTYRYKIKAIDSAGLSSEPSTPLTIKATSFVVQKAVKNLKSVVNREQNYIELSWKPNDEVAEYTIYKQLQDKQPTTWRILSGNKSKLTDKEVSPNETYTYHIKAVLKSGNYTKVEQIKVKY